MSEEALDWKEEHGWPQQIAPMKTDGPAVWDLVLADLDRIHFKYPSQQDINILLIADVKKRDAAGAKKYGVRLQPLNGRDALQDAYEEALDAIVYVRQKIEEIRIQSQLIVTPENTVLEKHLLDTYFLQIEIALRLRFVLKNEEKNNNVVSTESSDHRDPEKCSTD